MGNENNPESVAVHIYEISWFIAPFSYWKNANSSQRWNLNITLFCALWISSFLLMVYGSERILFLFFSLQNVSGWTTIDHWQILNQPRAIFLLKFKNFVRGNKLRHVNKPNSVPQRSSILSVINIPGPLILGRITVRLTADGVQVHFMCSWLWYWSLSGGYRS